MKENPAFWRRFAESVTNFAQKFNRDQFSRTQIVIVSSLVFLCLANIIIFAVATHYSNLSSASLARESVSRVLKSGTLVLSPTAVNEALAEELEHLRDNSTIIAGTVSIIITLILGYLIGVIALRPTRNALYAQKQFIANIAHELRTPLSIIKANNEILRMEMPGNREVEKTVLNTLEELDRISGIINNLLTLQAFRDRQPEFSRVNVAEVLNASADKLENLIESKKQTLKRELDAGLYVHGDQNAIMQMAFNLIKNASIYTGEKGQITLKAEALADNNIEFSVTDNGIGIEEGNLSRIFEPFYRVDDSRSGSYGSRGLGLAIVSELVKMHKGSISIRSKPNFGTTISISLPAAAPVRHRGSATTTNEYKLNFADK